MRSASRKTITINPKTIAVFKMIVLFLFKPLHPVLHLPCTNLPVLHQLLPSCARDALYGSGPLFLFTWMTLSLSGKTYPPAEAYFLSPWAVLRYEPSIFTRDMSFALSASRS